MSADAKKPPAFFCPACGQKHRTPIDSLEGKPGAYLRATCVKCALPLRVSLAEDGSLACEKYEEAVVPPAIPVPPAVSAPPVPAGRPEGAAEEDGDDDKDEDQGPTSGSKGKPARSGRERGRKGRSREEREAARRERRAARAAAAQNAPAPSAPASEAAPVGSDAAAAGAAAASTPAPIPASVAAAARAAEAEAQSAAPEETPEFAAGQTIGRYAIEGSVGFGGTSIVYRAFDPTTNRTVALKVLRKGQSDAMRDRFLREIEVQANIRHQNIMPVFDRGTMDDGRPYFTMELLYRPFTLTEIARRREEGTLGRYATLKPLQDLETLIADVFVPVCDGIYVANAENGVVHRDLKPDNILVDSRTLRPYVIDLGICQLVERKGGLASKAVMAPSIEDAGIVGTPRFLAPEQARGSVHARTDVWGLGAILHYLLSGDAPIAAATAISRAELARRVQSLKAARAEAEREGAEARVELIEEKLARLQDAGLRTMDDLFLDAREGRYQELPASTPPALAAIVKKAMALAPSDRYVNARQFSSEVQSFLKGSKVRALSEQGGTAAAVAGARRALRRHVTTAMWVGCGLLIGLGIGAALSGKKPTPPSTRVADADDDLKALLDVRLPRLMSLAPSLRPIEAQRVYHDLVEQVDGIEARLRDEPTTADVEAVRERVRFVRQRFQAPRVGLELPAGSPANVQVRDLVNTHAPARRVATGEVELEPGLHEVLVEQGAIRFHVHVPLIIRPNDKDPSREPLLATYRVPLTPAQVPSGMVLVLGGFIRTRDMPFAEPSVAPKEVKAFLIDQREVTNLQYATYLRTLPPEERKARAPSVAFVPDPANDGIPELTRGADELPVAGIRGEDAQAYAAWRAQKDAASVRLPSESEWVLAAGAALGYDLPGGLEGLRTDGDFSPPLRPAGEHRVDRSPFGVLGMFGNARELVVPSEGGYDGGTLLVKGAGVGDDPDQGAIYMLRPLKAGERHSATGFRCVRELK